MVRLVNSEITVRCVNQLSRSLNTIHDNTFISDGRYIGSSTGLDEVNYKLQAFMELWKGLAHDVDDLYDKVVERKSFYLIFFQLVCVWISFT